MASKKGSARLPTRRPGIDRYDKVLGAAERIILENESLDGLTLQAIAAEAKVPRVSLYYFFPSIDAVIEALYQRILTRLINLRLVRGRVRNIQSLVDQSKLDAFENNSDFHCNKSLKGIVEGLP